MVKGKEKKKKSHPQRTKKHKTFVNRKRQKDIKLKKKL